MLSGEIPKSVTAVTAFDNSTQKLASLELLFLLQPRNFIFWYTSLWASYGPEIENERYDEYFRMDKQGFDYIFSKIKGECRIIVFSNLGAWSNYKEPTSF